MVERDRGGAAALAVDVTPDVEVLLSSIGRTEDLRFSPDGGRLAIADFERDRVVVLLVVISTTVGDGSMPNVDIDGGIELSADALARPHGLDWIDEHHLVVGNRDGRVVVVPVPDIEPGTVSEHRAAVSDGAVAGEAGSGPGSVACRHARSGTEVYVCNNWGDVVTAHPVEAGPPPELGVGDDRVRRHVDLPDGVTVDAAGRWLAVSVHNQHLVQVYDLEDEAGPDDIEPAGVLRGLSFPHGLRFTPDGRYLLVADAGAPEVRRYDAPDGDWRRVAHPAASIVVLDDETFVRGHGREDEGGPKGLDIDPSGTVVAVTCEEAALRFFALAPMLEPADMPVKARLEAVDRERRVLATHSSARADRNRFEYLAAAAEAREHEARASAARAADEHRRVTAILEARLATTAASVAELEARLAVAQADADAQRGHIAEIEATRLWRVAAPVRSLYARLRGS